MTLSGQTMMMLPNSLLLVSYVRKEQDVKQQFDHAAKMSIPI